MSILDQARAELARVEMDQVDRDVILACMSAFFSHFNSGGAVSVVGPMLTRLLAGAPLTPLTGEDDEWRDMSEYGPDPVGTIYQNVRCSSVFKQRQSDGSYLAFDTSRPPEPEVERGPHGHYSIAQFPYMPEAAFTSPVVEATEKESMS